MGEPEFEFQQLEQRHRSPARRFRCGEEDLDVYLRTRASHDQQHGLATVRILYDPERSRIAGFYTLSSCIVERRLLPDEITEGKSRYAHYPATLLGRLARDLEYAEWRVGRRLLFDAIHRSVVAAQEVASFALLVDAKTVESQLFYERYGFMPLDAEGTRPRLYLPMDTIRQLF